MNFKVERFEISGKTVTVYPSDNADDPVIYLNMFADIGDEIYNMLLARQFPDFTLVTISNLNWDHDMSPWEIPPISKNDTPCTGGADEYLNLLENEIIPRAENGLKSVSWRGIAGYSLAGLFAVYSLYKTDIFARAASMSGSLWFPDFKEFVFENKLKRRPDYLYFSLGDKECKTRNSFLQTVEDKTREIEKFYRESDIDTCFELNPGNHFQNAAERTAVGITRILKK